MAQAFIEHVNLTVSSPKKTAKELCNIFDWKIRWQGDAIDSGLSYHVGSDTHYIAVYSKGKSPKKRQNPLDVIGGLNHIGIVVENLEEIEANVLAKGYETFAHADYEPGKRFYFYNNDEIEFEVISYL